MNIVKEKNITIKWDETDSTGRLSFPGLSQLLITTATEHAEELGFGYKTLKAGNLNWVLFRMNFEISEFPGWNEKIKVTTWPSGVKGLLGLREFMISNDKGENIVKVSSEWMIIDLKTRRPKRLNNFEEILKYQKSEKVTRKEPLLVNDKGKFNDIFEIKAMDSHLDLNGHVTAKRYFEWINDGIFEIHGKKDIEQIQVTFFHETYIHEKLTVQSDENGTTFRGMKENNTRPAFTAAVKFKNQVNL